MSCSALVFQAFCVLRTCFGFGAVSSVEVAFFILIDRSDSALALSTCIAMD